jgi:hypothetical protein
MKFDILIHAIHDLYAIDVVIVSNSWAIYVWPSIAHST